MHHVLHARLRTAFDSLITEHVQHRNSKRFPEDFMVQLRAQKSESLRTQIATLKNGRGQYHEYLQLAFTEQGIRKA